MIIALLAALGVDLIVIVGLVAVMLTRRRWASNQSGAHPGQPNPKCPQMINTQV